jgi:hypothetical protein
MVLAVDWPVIGLGGKCLQSRQCTGVVNGHCLHRAQTRDGGFVYQPPPSSR